MSQATLLATLAALTAAAACYYLAVYLLARRALLNRLHLQTLGPAAGPTWVQRVLNWVDESYWGEKTAKRLVRADLAIRPSLFGLLQLGGGLLLFGLLRWGDLDLSWAASMASMTAWWGTSLWLHTRSGRITASVELQLPRVTRLLANALRAGLSIRQGFEAVAKDIRPPAGPVFRRLHEELQLNVPVEQALDRLVDRVPSPELQLLADVVLIQHRVGGDLVGALEEMTTTLVERQALNQEARTATAQQRFVAWVLPFMLLGTMAMMGMVLPGFLTPLFSKEGILLVVIPVGLAVAGSVYLVFRFASVRW